MGFSAIAEFCPQINIALLTDGRNFRRDRRRRRGVLLGDAAAGCARKEQGDRDWPLGASP
jgi:hypothetical protein